MILKALCDYYNRRKDLAPFGMEWKQIGFVIVIDKDGNFIRIEDCRNPDNKTAKTFLVSKSVNRTSAPIANYLYDNSAYVIGYSEKGNGKEGLCLDTFKKKVKSIAESFPDNLTIRSIQAFYDRFSREDILDRLQSDPLWEEVKNCLTKKYSWFSFRIDGDAEIAAEKKELMQINNCKKSDKTKVCLVTGEKSEIVDTTTPTMIPGSNAFARLVSFQVKSGYDSYGKEKCENAPISQKAEFEYTTALNTMLAQDSRNMFVLSNRTYLFWASSDSDACKQAEENTYKMFADAKKDKENPNAGIEQIRNVFESIYSGKLESLSDDKFYILGLAPNTARIAVVYWAETTPREFAGKILKHFDDMEIADYRKEKRPYKGLKDILSSVTLGGKQSDATPNLADAIVISIFQGCKYPQALLTSCIGRIRAEQDVTPYNSPCRVAVLKACINRCNTNNINKPITVMLDKNNTNPGYLCGRMFAVLDRMQELAIGQRGIFQRCVNSASSRPATVFASILNLSCHHSQKLNQSLQIYFEKLKQEILAGLSAGGFPTYLNLQDQGRFFVGYYHQRQEFFTPKAE